MRYDLIYKTPGDDQSFDFLQKIQRRPATPLSPPSRFQVSGLRFWVSAFQLFSLSAFCRQIPTLPIRRW
jgi:hypothetical protein